MEALAFRALDLEMVHVPFKGSSQSVPALVSGQVQAVYAAYPSSDWLCQRWQSQRLLVHHP
jgi:tripartite-type tricarboxylate transporter receptor subunit TctC